jgi:hypothetical protein
MIHLFNGQYWHFPAVNEFDSPQDTVSSRLVIADTNVDSLSSSNRAEKATEAKQAAEKI